MAVKEAVDKVAHPSLDERQAKGREASERTPPASHSGWRPAADRPDPVALLEEQDLTREQDLVPVRHGRMMVSPFTFYRGGAKIMAADLKDTPVAGLGAQLCGDAHLSNFGLFASPERRLLFDLNDFDETLPGPFEYDVKRMAASFTIAARNNGFSRADARAATQASVTAYREAMAEFAQMPTMDIWYAHLDEDELRTAIRSTVAETKKELKGKKGKKDEGVDKLARRAEKRAQKTAAKAHTRDSLSALSKLCELAGGQYQIVSQAPVIVPARDLAATYGLSPDEVVPVDPRPVPRLPGHPASRPAAPARAVRDRGRGPQGRRRRQRRDPRVHHPAARTRRAGPAFPADQGGDASVLEAYLPKSRFRQHGQRVVEGQRMMQAASDIYLGWTKGLDVNRHFYWRQLRDMKGSILVEEMIPLGLTFYGRTCGWTLARAHARSGDPVAIAAYLGASDAFDKSITDFSQRYADQNEQDYEDFVKAVRSGRLQAVEGV